MKAIMYHYVRPFNPEYPNFKNLDIEDFVKQLDYFEETFGFVSHDDFLQSVKSGKPVSGVVLTFDDGLSCHYEYVFPELKRRNLWGIFYVPTQPYMQGKFLDVHRTHLLLGKYDSRVIYEYLNPIVNESILDHNKLEEFKRLTYTSQINDDYTLMVKRILNYFLSYEYREQVVDQLMAHFIPNEAEVLAQYYITAEQIKEMHEAGMVMGSHTVNHPVMSRLSVEEQAYQINASFEYLENIVGAFPHKTFCYPYGGFHSFTDDTERLLKAANCVYSFNVEHRDIVSEDLSTRPQALPRFDCNKFKYGQVRVRNLI